MNTKKLLTIAIACAISTSSYSAFSGVQQVSTLTDTLSAQVSSTTPPANIALLVSTNPSYAAAIMTAAITANPSMAADITSAVIAAVPSNLIADIITAAVTAAPDSAAAITTAAVNAAPGLAADIITAAIGASNKIASNSAAHRSATHINPIAISPMNSNSAFYDPNTTIPLQPETTLNPSQQAIQNTLAAIQQGSPKAAAMILALINTPGVTLPYINGLITTAGALGVISSTQVTQLTTQATNTLGTGGSPNPLSPAI